MFSSASSLQDKALLRSEKNEKLLMEENKKCKKEMARLVENNLKLQKELRLLKDKLKAEEACDNKIKELQETVSDLQSKQEEWVKNLSRIQEENVVLQREVKTLCNKNAIQTIWREQQAKDLEGFDKLKKEAKLMASDISQLMKQKDDLEESEQQNLNKIRELQKLLQEEQTKSKNAEEALSTERLNRQSLSVKDKEILTTLNDKVEGLQRESNGLLNELNKSRNQVKSLKKDTETLTAGIQRESVRNKKLSELLEVKTLESDQLQTELQSKDETLRGMKEEAVKARNIIHWMELELQKLSLQSENDQERNMKVVSAINEEVEGLKKEVKEREDNEAKLLMQVSALEDQIKDVEGKLCDVEGKCCDVEGKLCDVQMELSESERENASLKEVNEGLNGDIRALEAQLANAKSENQLLHNRLEQMRKQMEETEANNKKKLSILDRELTTVRNSLTGTEEERQGLTKDLEECLDAVFKSSRKLNQLQSQNSEAEEKAKELTKENNNLLEENKKLKLFKAYWLFLSETIMDEVNE